MKSMSDTATTNEYPLPPASFEFLVASLRMQAEMELGLLHFGDKDQPPADLSRARTFIDLLGVLEEKTRGNLSLEEKRLLENSLAELRFRYIQATEDAKKAAS
jgi:hypothetical protein